ncbi:MAG: serine/threonine protein kinase, partial [Deltaproteobacteria bacterium]|nr:serine/threonine protein kinase [Deltaproteobacteria bacterium]MBW2532080.1 serine/threonine protein kinase [Deltaproteobacteria bacterium]
MGAEDQEGRGPGRPRDVAAEGGVDRAELPTRQLDGQMPDESEVAKAAAIEHVAPTFEPGALVAHFKVMRRLGRGGMGEVYLARDTTLGRRVALKVLHPKRFDSESARSRFLFEARTTAKFNHPNIVTVYAVGEHEGRPYLAMEYVEGDSLKARLEDRRLSLQEALRTGRAIAIALVEAESHGVLHRDLKPGNVIIGRDGRVRVLDFGLAKVLETQHSTLASTAASMKSGKPDESTITTMEKRSWGVGTPQYMAPEQWRNTPGGPATDVWALGVMLFRMVSGKLPFNESTIVEQALMVCDFGPSPRVEQFARVPPPVGDIIARCLAKEAEQRPTAAEVVEALTEQIDAAQRTALHQQDPFRGLLPFTSEQAHLFFGREAEIASFVERVRSLPVLPVVGPTAAGKSSFVRAGVIPRLKEQEPWSVFYLRPGARPFQALASRL